MLLALLLMAAAPNAGATCAVPRLDFTAADGLGEKDRARFTENFRTAFDKACAEKMFASRPLIDPQSHDRSLLRVLNAPEANIASIYFGPSAAPPAMLLEAPIIRPDGSVSVPTADELHEAIYCSVVGATPEEEETSGRCLPD